MAPRGNTRVEDPAKVAPADPRGLEWARRLQELACRDLPEANDPSSREKVLGEAWLLVNSVVSRCIRAHAAKMGGISREDSEDLAAEESLELLRRMESNKWEVSDRLPGEIAAYLSTVARNSVINWCKRSQRHRKLKNDAVAAPQPGAFEAASSSRRDDPSASVEGKEFAKALRRCFEQLNPRFQMIWFFRVFYGMSTKEIARHPDVQLKPGHVDVLLQRARDAIRACMQKRGLDSRGMPTGTFVEIWRAFSGLEGEQAPGAVD